LLTALATPAEGTLNATPSIASSLRLICLTGARTALFIGVGATKGRKSGLDGENAPNAYLAMDFLTTIQKKIFDEPRELDIDVKERKVVVIGGGDTAMDCVRTSLREKAKSIKCLYRRDAHNMPGSRKEYINAKEEGVEFEFYSSPKRLILNDSGRVIALEMVKTKLGSPDASGRQRVEEIVGSEYTIDADIVIFALGFDKVNYLYPSLCSVFTMYSISYCQIVIVTPLTR